MILKQKCLIQSIGTFNTTCYTKVCHTICSVSFNNSILKYTTVLLQFNLAAPVSTALNVSAQKHPILRSIKQKFWAGEEAPFITVPGTGPLMLGLNSLRSRQQIKL